MERVGFVRTFAGWCNVFFLNKKRLYWFGFALTLALSLSEVLRGRELNFFIFSNATRDFWSGINPYSQQWSDLYGLDHFLYGPLFNILFAPFAFLPQWLGAIVWNLFNYTLYFSAIFYLPRSFTEKQKCYIYLYTMLILATTQLSFQFNVTVAYLYLYAFLLLEKEKPFFAICLILIGGFTKIYGFVELALLIFYPKFWRNMGYVLLVSSIFILLPLIKIPAAGLIGYYHQWLQFAASHSVGRPWETFFYIRLLFPTLPHNIYYYQMGGLFLLMLLGIFHLKRFGDFSFRIQVLGIMMGWIILFSNMAEKHTYVIALLGYLLWYFTITPRPFDKWLLICNFMILVVMPVDLLCPPSVMRVVDELNINLWLFFVTFLVMVYRTMIAQFVENALPSLYGMFSLKRK